MASARARSLVESVTRFTDWVSYIRSGLVDEALSDYRAAAVANGIRRRNHH